MAEFFETRIENLEWFDSKKKSNKDQKHKSNKKRKRSNQNVSEEKSSQGAETGKKFCQYHGMYGHSTNECTIITNLIKQAKLKKAKQSTDKKYTKYEVNILVEKNDAKCFQKE